MSRHKVTTIRRTAVGAGIAGGTAFAAALIGLAGAGAAGADPTGSIDSPFINTDLGGFSELFGGTGTAQGTADATLDASLLAGNPSAAASFAIDVAGFEAAPAHPITGLIDALDPSAFEAQITPGIDGTLAAGAYLIPDDFLGYLATFVDFDLLNPLGLSDVLGPIIDVLLGQPL